MIVTDKGIILIHDEVMNSPVVNGKVVVPHSYISRVIERAKSVCYDATSENAVKAVLRCWNREKLFYPFMTWTGRETLVCGMDYLFLESESVNFRKQEPYKPKSEIEKLVSLCVNRHILATMEEIWSASASDDTNTLSVAYNKIDIGIDMLFTSKRQLLIGEIAKLSDGLWRIGWVIDNIKEGSITVIPSKDKSGMKDAAKAVHITKKIVKEIKHDIIMYEDGMKTVSF